MAPQTAPDGPSDRAPFYCGFEVRFLFRSIGSNLASGELNLEISSPPSPSGGEGAGG